MSAPHPLRHRRGLAERIASYRRLRWPLRFLIWLLLIVALILLFPLYLNRNLGKAAGSAQFYFLPLNQTVAVGQTFPVELRIKTNGHAINAQGFVLDYDTGYFQVTNMTTEQSFCTFYLDNAFDNLLGQVKVSCGVPNPGFLGDALAVRLTVYAKAAGTSSFTLQDGAKILANDGKGSNIIGTVPKLDLSISQF